MSREVRRDSLRTPENVKVTLQCLQGKGLGIDPGALVAKSGDLFYGALNTPFDGGVCVGVAPGTQKDPPGVDVVAVASHECLWVNESARAPRWASPWLASRPPTFRRDAAGEVAPGGLGSNALSSD